MTAVAVFAGAACVPFHHQGATPAFCVVPQSGAEFGPVRWAARNTPDAARTPPSPLYVSRSLSGTWDVLDVTTQGGRPGDVDRWMLRLVSTVPEVWFQTPFGPRQNRRHAVVAAGAPIRESITFDSTAAAQRHLTRDDRIEASYDSTSNRITFSFGPPMLDAGMIYYVTAVSDTLITGRWTDGSLLFTQVQRGGTTTLEHLEGFFCARRREP